MPEMKLSESQKRLIGLMRTKQMWFKKDSYGEIYDIKGQYVSPSTAKALFRRGIFTVDDNGYCNLTELGKTIKL